MAHYYTNDEVKSEPTSFDFNFDGSKIHFNSDAGVFSKNFIDYGSQVMLRNIEIKDGQSILDVGCGYGAMGISLSKVHHVECTMVDVNLRALDLCRRNAKENNIDNYHIFESNCYENVSGTFDVIFTNPPIRAGKDVVTTILTGSYDHLNNDGSMYVVIQKKQGAPSAKKKLEEVYGNCEIIARDKGYYILKSKKEI